MSRSNRSDRSVAPARPRAHGTVPPRGRGGDAERGFSLFETLAALVIASLLATVLTQAFALAARGAAAAEDSVAAMLVARAMMDELRLAPGRDQEGRAGPDGAYRWRARFSLLMTSSAAPPKPRRPAADTGMSAPTGPRDRLKAKPIRLYRIDLDVQAPSGRHAQLQSLVARADP